MPKIELVSPTSEKAELPSLILLNERLLKTVLLTDEILKRAQAETVEIERGVLVSLAQKDARLNGLDHTEFDDWYPGAFTLLAVPNEIAGLLTSGGTLSIGSLNRLSQEQKTKVYSFENETIHSALQAELYSLRLVAQISDMVEYLADLQTYVGYYRRARISFLLRDHLSQVSKVQSPPERFLDALGLLFDERTTANVHDALNDIEAAYSWFAPEFPPIKHFSSLTSNRPTAERVRQVATTKVLD